MLQDELGRPLKDLRISVTDRCNFRCPYCMPAETYGEKYRFLPHSEILTFEEIARLTRLLVGLGASKVRLTGGEPLLREDLPVLVGQLAALDGVDDLTLTTNGSLLAGAAPALKRAGLHRLTVSLDSLDEAVFVKMNGRGLSPDRVLEGIAAAEAAGLSPLKINAVVMRGLSEDSIVPLARRFRGTGHIVRFIEYMDVGNINHWKLDQVMPAAEILARIHAVHPVEPLEANYPGEVARRYRYKDGAGEVGLIASVTQPFCGDCTRARLSTDGRLFTCLFATQGTDLRGPMRAGATDDELRDIIGDTWIRRSDRYSEERAGLRIRTSGKIEMFQIGG
jgi:cyclic pyranopterin phosphate synthase